MNYNSDVSWPNPASLPSSMIPMNLGQLSGTSFSTSTYPTQNIACNQNQSNSQLTQEISLGSYQNDGADVMFGSLMSFRERHKFLDGIYNSYASVDDISAPSLKTISFKAGLCMEEVLSWFEDEKERRAKLLASPPSQKTGQQFPLSPADTTTPPQNSTTTLCMSQCGSSPLDIPPPPNDIFPHPSVPLNQPTSQDHHPIPTKAKRGRPAKSQGEKSAKASSTLDSKRQRLSNEYPCPDCKKLYPVERWAEHVRRVHFPDQVWECQQINNRSRKACTSKPCYRADNFANHLKSEHGCSRDEILQLKHSSKFRVINFFHHTCGFCGEALSSRDESIDHVKDHFWEISQRSTVPVDLGISEWKERCGSEHILIKGVHYGFEESSDQDAPGEDDGDDGDNNAGNNGGSNNNSSQNSQDPSSDHSDKPSNSQGHGDGSFDDGGFWSGEAPGFTTFGDNCTSNCTSVSGGKPPQTTTYLKRGITLGLEDLSLPFVHIKNLGKGGHGSVDEVVSASSMNYFARKSVPRRRAEVDPSSSMKHLKNELAILKELEHPNLVKVVGAYTDDEYSHIIMSPVADQNLADFMKSTTSYPPYNIFVWMSDLTLAIDYLHSRQVKHLDVKPQNILVKGNQILLADFGTAKSLFDKPTGYRKEVAATPMYCSPETILHGHQEYSADVFSLGCVFAELLTYAAGYTIAEFENFRSRTGNKSFHMTVPETQLWINRLKHTSNWPPSVFQMVIQMVEENPAERPSAKHLKDLFCTTKCTTDQFGTFEANHSTLSHPPSSGLTEDMQIEMNNLTETHASIYPLVANNNTLEPYDIHRGHINNTLDPVLRTYSVESAPSLYSGASSVPDSEYSEISKCGSRNESPYMLSKYDHLKLPYSFWSPFESDSPLTPFIHSNIYTPPTIHSHNAVPYPYPLPETTSHKISPRVSTFSGLIDCSKHWQDQVTHSSDQVDSDSFHAEEDKEKGQCTYPECRKVFKDMKAHILTHQNDRPEKCPIPTCDYHIKGFARKYDKNRHTLTHYKGTMICGFCPGSGSPAEKSFNRADVFKRHLTSVHGVEQYPPNSRKKSNLASKELEKNLLSGHVADATGKCSTCNSSFTNAQDFYEHLDDCVLRIVQQEEPSEAINAARLAEVENDIEVQETLRKCMLPSDTMPVYDAEDDNEEMDDESHSENTSHPQLPPLNTLLDTSTSRSLTGPKDESMANSRRLKRKDYPSSWGYHSSQMKMKKRVICVFDGPRRLLKDDTVLGSAFDAHTRLGDPKALTDPGVELLKTFNKTLYSINEDRGGIGADGSLF